MADFDCVKPCIVCPPAPPGALGLGLSPNDPNNPYNNLSSEAPDVDLFIGRRFTPPGLGNPPLGSTWFSIGCLGFAFSSVSQEDADLMAQQQAVLCTSTEWPLVVMPNVNPNLPPTVTPRPVFFSAPASCDFTCPDGSIFTYTVPAGFFFAFSQVSADAMAASFACNQVVANRSCFGPEPTSRTCLDAAYSSSIAVASANLPITFTIQSGSLPPGIVEAQSPDTYFLSGTPTIPGDYTFLLRATDSTGGFIEKQISISVFGIINTSPLDNAAVGVPYSANLTYAGTAVGAVSFAITSGAMPDGLVMNPSTGDISGTPTTEQTAVFTVRISDDTISCSKQFVIEVETVADVCPDESYFFGLGALLGRSEPGCLAATSDIGNPNRMFVPTQTAISENRVSVFDTDTNGLISTIVPSADFLIRGIAYYPDLETVFMAYNKITAVTEGGWLVYDAVGLGLVTTIAAPALVSETTVRDCLYDATTALVYSYGGSAAAGNPRNGYLVSINPATNSVVSTVAVNDPGGFTDFGAVRSDIAICESLSRLYIAITTGDSVNDFSRVEIVSLPGLGSLGSVSIAPWGRVFIIGVAQDTNKLYVMASNLAVTEDALIIIDLNTNSVISTTSYGSHEGWASFAYISDKGQVVIGRNESGGAAINFYVLDTTTDETVCVVPSISVPVTGAAAMIYNPTWGEINTYVDRVNRIDVYFY